MKHQNNAICWWQPNALWLPTQPKLWVGHPAAPLAMREGGGKSEGDKHFWVCLSYKCEHISASHSRYSVHTFNQQNYKFW